MKRYKVKEVRKMLEKFGWQLTEIRGDHFQFTHPERPGKVTLKGKPNEVLGQFLLNSIWKQAGWR